MFKLSPAIRLSIGLVMFTLSVILVADLIGVVPKKDAIVLDARKKICEVLAVQLSMALSQSEFNLVKSSLEVFVVRNDDVIAASMTEAEGTAVAEYGDFSDYVEFNKNLEQAKSTDDIVIVPVFSGTERWGSVNIEFKSIYSDSMFAFLTDSILGILLFVAVSCFIGYMFILRRALSVLDPKSVVPDRVRSAFNALSEGVLIIDKKEQIIMANNAFAKKINQNANDLLGVKASSLKWKYANRELRKIHDKMPWVYAIQEGVIKTDMVLNLTVRGSGVRSFSSNSTPIKDDNGITQGALVTINDITDIQETNVLLENAVNAVNSLKKDENEVSSKNVEVEVNQ
ncbi:MAG: PAS domain-containing protein [Gammaproteobacteria bacterium]